MGRLAYFLPCLIFLISCTTANIPSIELEDIQSQKYAISLPMQMSPEGLIILQNVKIEDETYNFAVDTGATHSAIFENSLDFSRQKLPEMDEKMIHGIVKSETRQTVKVPKLELGSLAFTNKSLVVLPDGDISFGLAKPFDGLIGMDVFSPFQIYVSPKTSEFILLPNKFQVRVPANWRRIELAGNPFKDDRRALHFMEVRLAGKNVFALLDTGSEFSAMNWKSAQYSQLKRLKRSLRKEWELQGAVGSFKPVYKVTLERLRSGQKFWEYKDFLVMDFESLDVLGVSDDAFGIIGMNMLKDDAFFIDFDRNFISFRPLNSE